MTSGKQTDEKKNDSIGGASLVWFRDDLRISDHPALKAAEERGKPVLAVYIHDEVSDGLRKAGAAQKWFLHHALASLEKKLKSIGGRLDILSGPSKEIIQDLVKTHDVGAVYWNRRCGGPELETDADLKSRLKEDDIEVESFQGNLLHEPYRLETSSGGPYRVYSPFWRALREKGEPREPLPAPEKLKTVERPDDAISLADLDLLPTSPNWAKGWEDIWQADEDGAHKALKQFLAEDINDYAEGRDFPAKNTTSRLSPYLRYGLISPYQIWHATREAEDSGKADGKNAEKFLKELAWREFSYHLLFHYPDISWKNYLEKFDDFPWSRADQNKATRETYERWTKGQTGYPIVDAGMRELWQTGYMHNRVRMIVGSFLVKHLLIHWRDGEEWFWDTLVDADPANNTASWQWVAGSGADAAPYFRVFNPILQGKKFDPEGKYVRQYVPEIADLPDKYLHNPWEAPKDVLKKADISLGETYPRPIIEHSEGRERALEAFKAIKKDDS